MGIRSLRILSLLGIFYIIAYAEANWKWQNPFPQGADMFAVICLSNNRTIITGSGGTIMTTEDGGQNWFIQRLPQVDFVRRYCFISDHEGWIIGNTSKIFKTDDAGLSWQQLNISIDIDFSNYDLCDMAFINSLKGFLLANAPYTRPTQEHQKYPGRIYKTEDGGIHWIKVDSGMPGGDYNQIVFQDSINGFLLTQSSYSPFDFDDSRLYKTNNSGNTWSALQGQGYGKVQFVSKQVGWAGQYKSSDGGQTWHY